MPFIFYSIKSACCLNKKPLLPPLAPPRITVNDFDRFTVLCNKFKNFLVSSQIKAYISELFFLQPAAALRGQAAANQDPATARLWPSF